MKLFRQILFWSHLAAGLTAGLFIGVMSFTGTTLAFEDELVTWAERDARQVTPPAILPSDSSAKTSATTEALAKQGATRLSLADLQHKLREAQPEFRTASMTLQNDPTAAVAFSAGRDGGFYINPYTGEIRQPSSTKVHDFMQLMLTWHRFLGREGDQRPIGKAINGACNIAFFVLAVTGLYLWWPRTWSWRGIKAIALFNWKLSGKARDFNWHNAIGLWSAPILIVLTLTAVPMSYRWGSNLIYQLVGEEPPAPPGVPGTTTTPTFEIKRPSPEARPLGYDTLVATIQKDFPHWEQIVLRTGVASRGQRPAASMNASVPHPATETVSGGPLPDDLSRDGSRVTDPRLAVVSNGVPGQIPDLQLRPAPAETNPGRIAVRNGAANNGTQPHEASPEPAPIQRERSTPSATENGSEKIENQKSRIKNAPSPLTITIREAGSWPRTATTTLTLNPFTGEILKREGFGEYSTGRQIRTWTRFLHTGQALGWPGQLIAGLACLGACFLVYTGFALSFRRFFGRGVLPPIASTQPSQSS